jgi:2C-methyl-D-erythritol 2,4-cyclodiphosphate synthase
LVGLERALVSLSAKIKEVELNFNQTAGEPLTMDQREALQAARRQVIDAGYSLHSVASTMVGELKKS